MSITIALVGNPNSGKTTLFNQLTGSSQYVGNWPGVTVEKKEGKLKGYKNVKIIDLPGIYSLSPYTLEEIVSRNYLLQEKPDVILNIVDGTNLERNLYLTTQLLEIGLPIVVAVNMIDIVRKNRDKIDIKKLSQQLKCDVIEISAIKSINIIDAAKIAIDKAKNNINKNNIPIYSKNAEKYLHKIMKIIPEHNFINELNARFYIIKLFERDEYIIKFLKLNKQTLVKLDEISNQAKEEFDSDPESIIANERYNYITKIIPKFYKKNDKGLNTSDKIDKIVTNRFLAFPIFIFIMAIIYFISITLLGKLASDWINNVFFGDWIQPFFNSFLENIGSAKWLISLVNDGIIAGVGSVLSFVPQMFILFFFLSVLEDCGYMTRVAFIMDRVFRKFGLSGKSFIPLLISSGCGVPGIMATKTIENEKHRRLTIMTTTFIPCSAKLPIISLIGGAIFSDIWYIAPTIYFIGIAAVILSGIMLKKTKPFRGEPTPFVMELPQYHIPPVKSTLLHIWENVRSFIVKAGTIIFLASALIWFLSNFGITNEGFCMVEETKSMLAAIGMFIAPIFAPLGFSNWHATVATISGLFAKENIVSTFGVIMGLSDATETNADFLTKISELFPYSAAALSFLVFNLLCAPCFAAIGAIYKQMSSAKWTLATITFQTLFAYTLALIINQIGGIIYGDVTFNIWTIVAFLLVVVMLILIFRPTPSDKKLLNRKVLQE